MLKSQNRIATFLFKKDKNPSPHRYNSQSLKKHNRPHRHKKQYSIRPFQYVFTDTQLLNKKNQPKKDKHPFKKINYQLQNPLTSKYSQKKQKSRQKSSLSKPYQQKPFKSKSNRSKSKQEKKIERLKAIKKKYSPLKTGSQKSKSTQRKKRSFTKHYSTDNFSKTFKVAYQKEKILGKSKQKKWKGIKWEQILQKHGQYLTASQISEIRDIKIAYFLGKIKERKSKQLFSPNRRVISSSKTHHNHNCSEMYFQDEKEKLFYNQLLTERKQEKQKEKLEETKIKIPQDDFYSYEIGDHIAYRYQIISSINKGAFGEVLKVYDHKNKQFQALKVIKKSPQIVPQTLVQISILTYLRQKDKEDLSGIVKIVDFTIFRKHICIIFELLQNNLYELMVSNNHNGLPQDLVRIFAIQLLNSLDFLKKQNIIHCDLKPENIVMRKWGKSGIKIIDFGTSCFEGKQIYEYLQSRYYRAPEIMLGYSYSTQIDMWSLGCILAQLIVGEPIFAGTSDQQQLLYIANSIGYPDSTKGPFCKHFLISPEMKQIIDKNYIEEYKKLDQKQIEKHPLFSKFRHVKSSMQTFQTKIKRFLGKQSKLITLIQKMLVWEPSKRITPKEALQDHWIIQGLPKNMKKEFSLINKLEKKQQKSKSKSQSTRKQNKGQNRSSKQKGKIKVIPDRRSREKSFGLREMKDKKCGKYEQKNTLIKAKLEGIIN